jgi:hypothetical protein
MIALIVAALAAVTTTTPAQASPTASQECTAARFTSTYAWLALDDAERAGLRLPSLEGELRRAVARERRVCGGE